MSDPRLIGKIPYQAFFILLKGVSVKNKFFTRKFVPSAQSLQMLERYGD